MSQTWPWARFGVQGPARQNAPATLKTRLRLKRRLGGQHRPVGGIVGSFHKMSRKYMTALRRQISVPIQQLATMRTSLERRLQDVEAFIIAAISRLDRNRAIMP
jgi:hypothetical protein